jgi:hypothetical protein
MGRVEEQLDDLQEQLDDLRNNVHINPPAGYPPHDPGGNPVPMPVNPPATSGDGPRPIIFPWSVPNNP